MQTDRNRLFLSMLLVALAAPFIGCGKPPVEATPAAEPTEAVAEEPAAPVKLERDRSVRLAIVADADLLFHLDIAAMRTTPIIEAIMDRRDAEGKKVPGQLGEDEWVQIQELTGLTQNDFLSVLVSADLDTIDLDQRNTNEEIKNAMGACAIELAKPLTFEKLHECMRILSSSSKGATLEQIEIAGRPVARVMPTSPKEPVIHTAMSRSGRALLIAFNAPAMEGMLERDNASEFATPNSALVKLGSNVETGTQLRLLILASEDMRVRIRAKIDSMKDPNPQEQQTQTGMMVTFFNPIRNIRNLVLGAKAGDELDLVLAGDLDNPSEAQQCAHLMQAFIVPMVIKSFENSDPENKMQVDDSLHARNEGATLRFTLKVTQADVEHWNTP